MQVALDFHGPEVKTSEALRLHIQEHVEELERRFPGYVQRCRVAIERPHRHHKKGTGWTVKVELSVPAHHELSAIAAGGRGGEDPDDAYLTANHAFLAIGRQLERLCDMRRDKARQTR